MLTRMKSASTLFVCTAASKVSPQYVCRLKNVVCLYMYLCLNECICFFSPEKCARVHWHWPYRWQVLDGDGKTWKDLQNMEEIEMAYSDPKYDTSCMDESKSPGILSLLGFQRCVKKQTQRCAHSLLL